MAKNPPAADIGHLPEIVVLGPPTVYRDYEKEFSTKFRLLKPWESPLPLTQFLPGSPRKMQTALCGAGFSVSATVLQNLPALCLVVTASGGLNHIDLIECRRCGIAVTSAATIFSADVADLAVGLLLDVMRKISSGNRFLKNGLWPDQGSFPLASKLGGKRVGIVGLGSIGLEVAKRLEAFGCAISYNSKNKKPSVSYLFYPNVSELAAKSDILVRCCALTEQTHHMIDRKIMLALGKDGFIVNIARGAIIDEKALVSCLQNGDIAGVGLDMFEDEPRVPEELSELDNVVLSPHCAVFTKEATRELYELIVGNLEAFFSGKPLLSQVPEK